MTAALELTLRELERFLDNRADKLKRIDLRKPLQVILVLAKADIKKHFASGTAPDGSVWLPLKRPRQGKRHKRSTPLPLRDTGLLMASLTSTGSYHVERVTDDSLEVGTNLEYAAIQNFGGVIHQPERHRNKPWVFAGAQGETIFTRRIRAHGVTIPARPFLGWSESLLEQAADVLSDALESVI